MHEVSLVPLKRTYFGEITALLYPYRCPFVADISLCFLHIVFFTRGIESIRLCRAQCTCMQMSSRTHVRTRRICIKGARVWPSCMTLVGAACGSSLIRKKKRKEKPLRASELSAWRSAAAPPAGGRQHPLPRWSRRYPCNLVSSLSLAVRFAPALQDA